MQTKRKEKIPQSKHNILILLSTLFCINIFMLYFLQNNYETTIMEPSTKTVNYNNISLYTENFGNINNPTVLLISGAGAPARFWTNNFIQKIVDADYFVIRFDHRDQGLSSAVNFKTNPYTVLDLTEDAIAILNAYSIKKAHVIGHSMGGMIAQLMAIHYPDRILSITSISVGTVGNIGTPSQEIMNVLLENKPTQNFEESLSGFMKSWHVLNGNFPVDEQMAIKYTKDLYERSNHEVGVAWNHIKAQEGFGNLSKELQTITAPTFFIHGEKDPLIPMEAGLKTCKTVPHAKMKVISEMGHMIFNKELETILANVIINNLKSID